MSLFKLDEFYLYSCVSHPQLHAHSIKKSVGASSLLHGYKALESSRYGKAVRILIRVRKSSYATHAFLVVDRFQVSPRKEHVSNFPALYQNSDTISKRIRTPSSIHLPALEQW